MQVLKVDKKMTQSIIAIVKEREGRVWGSRGIKGGNRYVELLPFLF